MRWRFFFSACLLLVVLILYDEKERRLKIVRELLQRMRDRWSNSPVESR